MDESKIPSPSGNKKRATAWAWKTDKEMESVLWQNNQLSGKLLKAMGCEAAFSIAESRFPRSVSKEGHLKSPTGEYDEDDERRERVIETGEEEGEREGERKREREQISDKESTRDRPL